MDEIRAATRLVRRWRITAHVLFLAQLTLPWVLVVLMHRGAARSITILVTSLALYAGYLAASRATKRAINAHPLVFLVRIREAFEQREDHHAGAEHRGAHHR